ncbi:MAG: hypothetical protein NVV57_10500 [Demequina sp.]|nr:hypothetical protein [Demequina sp.]
MSDSETPAVEPSVDPAPSPSPSTVPSPEPSVSPTPSPEAPDPVDNDMPGISATVQHPSPAAPSGEHLVATSPTVELPEASVASEVVAPEESVMAPDTPDALEPDDELGLTEPVLSELVDTAFSDEPWATNAGTGRPDLALASVDPAEGLSGILCK